MIRWAPASLSARSPRWHSFKLSLLLFAASPGVVAHAQIAVVPGQLRVSLTNAAYLPVIDQGSVQTTIATALGNEAVSPPWRVGLTLRGRPSREHGQGYQVQVTNISSTPLNLPVGTDGGSIWSACQNSEIAEFNISLLIAGQPVPAANLPSTHSCAAVPSSFVTVLPGASIVFQGTLAGPVLAPEGSGISAVVSVCSAVYSLGGDDPHTTRSCRAPVTSNSTASAPLKLGLPPLPRVR